MNTNWSIANQTHLQVLLSWQAENSDGDDRSIIYLVATKYFSGFTEISSLLDELPEKIGDSLCSFDVDAWIGLKNDPIKGVDGKFHNSSD